MIKKHTYIIEYFIYFTISLLWYGNQFVHWNGNYLDTDNYMHALRLMDALSNTYWFEHIFPYTNYPFGEVLHWTRALDIFMLITALPFLAYFPLRLAVFYGGLLICPIFFLLAIFYLLKAGRLLMGAKYRFFAAILFIIQANVMRVVVLNRPDHHAAFVFLSAFIFYKLVKFAYKGKLKDITSAALMAAFALWMAAEGLLLFIAAVIFLYYGTGFLKYPYKILVHFCTIYSLAITFFFIINPPYEGYLFMDSGRLSLFYIEAAFWLTLIIAFAGRISSLIKQCLFIAGGCLILLLIYYFSGVLISPLDERIITPFIARINEMKQGDIYTLAYPTVGLILGTLLIKKHYQDGAFIYLFFSLALYGILSAFSNRFLPYSGMYAAIMMAFFLYDRAKNNQKTLGYLILFVLLEPFAFTIHAFTTQLKPEPLIYIPTQQMQNLPQGTVATDIFLSPYFLWYTQRPTIASPYHRNVEGIVDNHDIFFSTDEQKVKDLIKKHQVHTIYLYGYRENDDYYINPEKNCDKLYGKILGCRNYPDWLKIINTQGYYLFEVDYDKL